MSLYPPHRLKAHIPKGLYIPCTLPIFGTEEEEIRQKIGITALNGGARRAVAERHITRALRLTSFAKMLRMSQSSETVYAKIVEIKVKDAKHIPKKDIPNLIVEIEAEMIEAADKLDFERAIGLREKMNVLKKRVE